MSGFDIVLVEPEIPQNTGNIVRTCAITGAKLHLIRPLGFSTADRYLKRAGLDYWKDASVTEYDDLDDFWGKHPDIEYYLASTKAGNSYADVSYPDGCFLFFGKETRGLPEELVFGHPDRAIRVPMREGQRSLNLSNSVAIVLYEALRQHGFVGLR